MTNINNISPWYHQMKMSLSQTTFGGDNVQTINIEDDSHTASARLKNKAANVQDKF